MESHFIKKKYIVFLAFLVSLLSSPKIYSQAEKDLVSVNVVKPKLFIFENEIKINGSILANEQVNIASVVSEKIKEIRFKEGTNVKKNDVLVILENFEEQAKLKQVEAELEESEINYQRAKKLFDEGNTSRAILDKRLKEKKKLQGKFEEIQAKINDLILKAPFDGVLGTKNFSEGSFLKPGDVIVGIYDIEKVKVKINIPEKYNYDIKKGQKFDAVIPSRNKNRLTGRIFAVDPSIDRNTRTFIVLGIIDNNKENSLKPGMMVNIKIIFKSKKSLSVPEGSIIPEDDETFVYTIDNENKVVKKKVQIGKRKSGIVEIIKGIDQSEIIVFEGTNKIRNGTIVKINK